MRINWQRAHALSRRSKDRVAQGRNRGRQWRFAQPRRRVFRGQEMNIDRCRLRHPEQWECVVVGFHDPAVFDSDFLIQGFSEAVDDAALHHVDCSAGVDDMAADVADCPDLIDFHLSVAGNGGFCDLGKIAEMAVVEARDTQSSDALPERSWTMSRGVFVSVALIAQAAIACAFFFLRKQSRPFSSRMFRRDQKTSMISYDCDGWIGDDGAAVAIGAGKKVRRAGNVSAKQRNARDKRAAVGHRQRASVQTTTRASRGVVEHRARAQIRNIGQVQHVGRRVEANQRAAKVHPVIDNQRTPAHEGDAAAHQAARGHHLDAAAA